MNAIVSDATSLIVLGKLNRVDLLQNFFQHLVIPSQVMVEITAKQDYDHGIWQQDWLSVQDGTHLELYGELLWCIDPGESEAIALAGKLNLPLLMDEKKGRTIARNRRIPVIGLVGLLLRSVQRHHVRSDEAQQIINEARVIGFRLANSLAEEFENALIAMEDTHERD